MSTLPDTVTLAAAKQQASSYLPDEVIILNLQSGIYYGLNQVGARFWELIQTPTSLAEVRSSLLEDYDVTVEECDRDLQTMVQKLADAGLITVTHYAYSLPSEGTEA